MIDHRKANKSGTHYIESPIGPQEAMRDLIEEGTIWSNIKPNKGI